MVPPEADKYLLYQSWRLKYNGHRLCGGLVINNNGLKKDIENGLYNDIRIETSNNYKIASLAYNRDSLDVDRSLLYFAAHAAKI